MTEVCLVGSITQTIKSVFTLIGAIGTLVGIYKFIDAAINANIDSAIIKCVRINGVLSIPEIAGRIGKGEAKTESRLWSLLADKKLIYSQGFSGKHLFGPLPQSTRRP